MALEKRSDGIVDSDGHFYPWSYLGVTPNAHVAKLIERDRAAVKEAARKKARKEAAEADRLARLKRLKSGTYPAKGPRWFMTERGWTWHEYSDEKGGFVDTGIEPAPGIPIAEQRPEGR